VRLEELVHRIIRRLRSRPGAERVVVEVPPSTTAWTDEDRLERDLKNLIENAVKFSQEGAIKVSARELPDGSVEVSVRDEGVGIEEDRLGDLFAGPGPGRQVATPNGTGLGLYLARRILELQGGSLSVSSKPEAGSTFTMRLPGAKSA
jgi:signal transduction histidine kinase